MKIPFSLLPLSTTLYKRKAMNKTLLCLVVLASMTHVRCTAVAQVVFSTFDTDLDGWTVDRGSYSWEVSGGNPSGHLSADNHLDYAHGTAIAPSKFHGNWSSFEGGGTLRYDHRISTLGSDVTGYSPYQVVISGPGGEAAWTGSTPSGLTDWTPIFIPISPSSWDMKSGSWNELLVNVTSLQIRIEQVLNSTPDAGDLCHIDNVVLSKPPSEGTVPAVHVLPAVEVRHRLTGTVTFARPEDITIHPAVEVDFIIGRVGEVYQLEWTSDLVLGEWLPLGGPMIRGNSPIKMSFDSTEGHPQRFYRLVRLR
ncbi:MAG: hypothetical protein H7A46_15580 [Verrucomicrobiales bacterium]|nr:hypothetical protein [Verrucomicrobiales bacterium]